MNTEALEDIASYILELEDRTPDLPDELAIVETWSGWVDAAAAAWFLNLNVTPQKGVAGTNRPQVSGQIRTLALDIINGKWLFNHQGIAFDANGKLIDGQHRLEAILAADALQPGILVPLMITWALPPESNEKIDINARRMPGTFLAMDGFMASNRLATTLQWIKLYGECDFDEPLSVTHWTRRFDVPTLRALSKAHPIASEEGVSIGGKFQSKGLLTASAAAAGYTIIRERYSPELVADFIDGVLTGANLGEGDARLALRNWAINRRERGQKAVAYVHLAYLLKAFRFFRTQEPTQTLTFKPAVEKFPRA